MPTAADLARVPVFPGDLPLYDVTELSYAKLKSKRSSVSKTLVQTCGKEGIFLLNLGDCESGREMLKDVREAFTTGRCFFDDHLLAKKSYMGINPSFGYKPLGASKVDGKPDFTERYSLSTDALLRGGEALPKVIIDRRQLLIRLNYRFQEVATTILKLLERQLKLPKSSLCAFHDPSHSSGTVLRFLHNVKQVSREQSSSAMHPHKDIGTITILFNILGGLQVLPPGAQNEPQNWRWVEPKPNFAIIIIGDALVDLTNDGVRSAYHRVVEPPGDQAEEERYSFGYFLRPNDVSGKNLRNDARLLLS